MIRGIGPVYAKRMVKTFGEEGGSSTSSRPSQIGFVRRQAAARFGQAHFGAKQKVVREIMVFLHSHGSGLYRAEQVIADRLIRIVNGRLPWTWIDEEKALPWVEKRSGLQLAHSQRGAIRLALTAKALVITGGPGVGKTTIVNSILKILAAKNVRLLLCAPTGRAAKRMTEATGVEAKTIHRLLEIDPKSGGFTRNPDKPLECDLLVVDEASMVDVMLMQALMKATPDNAALLIVGDIDQLPSVGPGQVLADIIGSGVVAVVRLTEVFRQAAASRIIINAHRINQGSMPDSARHPATAISTSSRPRIPRPPFSAFWSW